MKRTQDKIKDLVEPQEFDDLRDFAANPERALAAYRFTDATSDLLARWLDALADLPRGHGAAHALAGMRGVGKSHTLATFGALVAAPEQQRARIPDAHVATSAKRLANRRHLIVRVARGTRPTLRDELVEAFIQTLGGSASDWAGDPAAWLANASARSRATTIVILADTAFGREACVKRDDGPLLSELALAARDGNAFVALALDDDIAGAEGANVALARTFHIDYLEPEHLYHIANIHLLRKTAPARDALHEIYLSLRRSVPNFNWSEPRFAALYPVHPLVADMAASVRLYAPTFAFLPFAAAAARNALNRPALSLILLDEIFDHYKEDLRKSEDLQEAFRVYDELAANGVSRFPAMQRLQVRLVLNSLFILSLDGRGATARELCAALLFHDEHSLQAAIDRVEEMLQRLAELAPPGGVAARTDGAETRYRFQVIASADFEAALAIASQSASIDQAALTELWHTLPRARFADWPFGDENHEPRVVDFQATWRGSVRPGQLIRQSSPARAEEDAATADGYDWQLRILEADGADAGNLNEHFPVQAGDTSTTTAATAPISLIWQPAAPTAEELSVLRRLAALRTDHTLADFSETARAAAISLAAQCERIWSRCHIDDGLFIIDDDRLPLTGEARAAQTFAPMLADALAPLFAARFPQHPQFTASPAEAETARLVENFFGGGNLADTAVQQLAELYALPLGLATHSGDIYVPETGDAALGQPWVREVLALVDQAGGEVVPLDAVHGALRRQPYGLLSQAQHLVLAALVAERRIELITASGDRISRCTLGSSLSWDEVAGVCRAAEIHHNAEALTNWARLLTNQPALPSIAAANARETVRAALAGWLTAWREETALRDFDAMPDAGLTNRAWNLAAAVRRAFTAAADAVEAALAGNLSLEEGLQRVADTFAAAPEQFAHTTAQLEALRAYTAGIVQRESVRAYLVAAELTGLEEIESARRELLLIADDPHTLFDAEHSARFELLWHEFQAHYISHYVDLHARSVGSAGNHHRLDEFMRGAQWRDFELLAGLPFVDGQLWEEAAALLAEVKHTHCDLPVAEVLATYPRCACSFRLARAGQFVDAATLLAQLTERGRAAHRRTLAFFHAPLARALGALANEETSAEVARRAYALAHLFAQKQTPPLFTHADARLIARALEQTPPAQPLCVALPEGVRGLLTRDELAVRWQQWFDELPQGTALVEITIESGNDGA
ncbi:MAG: hypothetical protein ACR2G4_04450 [Pyrinomonadaceae bacterium]